MRPTRQICCAIIALFVYTGCLYAQPKEADEWAELRPEVQRIIDQTHFIEAEFAIDILLKIVRSGKLPDNKWRKRLLSESFRRLDEVQQPLRRRLALAGVDVDNRQVRLSEALERRLDALSLRSEILREMLKADPQEARRLAFDTGFVPDARVLSCRDALTREYDPFYDVLGEVARATFNAGEIKDQIRMIKLTPFIGSMATVGQIAPVGRMIVTLNAGKIELDQLLLAYGAAIRAMSSSGREFSAFFWSNDWIRQFISVLKTCEKGEIQCSFLKDSLRRLVVRSFQSEICPDDRATYREHAPGLIGYLNESLFRTAPLKAEELKPSSIGPPVELESYGASKEAMEISGKYRLLNWKDPVKGGQEYSPEERAEPKWTEKFEELFSDVVDWTGSEEKDRASYFHQKSIFFTMIYEAAPSALWRAKVLRSFANFISTEPFKKESRIEWFLWAETMVKLIDKDTGLKFEILENSRDPVIQLYSAVAATRL